MEDVNASGSRQMTFQTAMLATLIVILGAAQYALCVQAIRDLCRRPRVRGENKVLWALGILCVPIAGGIVYNWMGPTSFIHRPLTSSPPSPLVRSSAHPRPGVHASNVTPISAARSARRRRVAAATHSAQSPTVKGATAATRIDRTGS
jgi:hypothetical protein